MCTENTTLNQSKLLLKTTTAYEAIRYVHLDCPSVRSVRPAGPFTRFTVAVKKWPRVFWSTLQE